MKKAYQDWTSGCRSGGYENGFTMVSWISWWLNTGQWDNRGVGADNVLMERVDKELSFNPGNVVCSKVSEARSRAAKEQANRRQL